MKNEELKEFLDKFDNNEDVECWVKIGDTELSYPNMAMVLRDEIFKWEDQLDDIDYVDDVEENIFKLFDFIDDILDELESRLQINPELIKELSELEKKVESGDMSDFVEIDLPEFSFQERAEDFANAKKIREYMESSESILRYVNERLPDLESYIEGSSLFICQKDNASISTSIIAAALQIEATNINDSRAHLGIYSINLKG